MSSNQLQTTVQRHLNCASEADLLAGSTAATSRLRKPRGETAMAYKETFWMACDSTEQLRAEYGPFHTREQAESEAKNLGFGYLLRYEHLLGENEEIQEVRCIFVELPGAIPVGVEAIPVTLHTRCATCGESSAHEKAGRPKSGPTSTSSNTPATASASSNTPAARA